MGRPGGPADKSFTQRLNKNDIIIDGGNSHFTDTARRPSALEAQGYHFFGMGVSGGGEGARHGPCMMPGGDNVAYQAVKPMLEAIAAQGNDEPCVSYWGRGRRGTLSRWFTTGSNTP